MNMLRRLAGVILQLGEAVEGLLGKALAEGLGLEGVEERLRAVVQRAAAEVLGAWLEGFDERLMAGRGPGLVVVGKRSRCLLY